MAVLAAALDDPNGFYSRYGGSERFNIVLVIKGIPFEGEKRLAGAQFDPLRKVGAHVVFDDRPPDEDAHTMWGANHSKGGVAVIRPDLWVGVTAFPDEMERVAEFFDGFLLE